MPNFLKLVGNSFVGLGVVACISAAHGADAARAAMSSGIAPKRANIDAMNAARMPTLPTLPAFTVGNTTQTLPANPPSNVGTVPSQPDNPPAPDQPDDPTPPAPECPDGDVKDSDYTIERCMNDVLSCVNASLPNGLASMYNEDLRNSIVNGMGLCQVQVERCVKEVRRDCKNVYRSTADVWIDFNTRRVQPEYYNFVLRKTGLTPHQAENTCRLLDKNTYGSSFNAVANGGGTTAEYNRNVGAYNRQNGNVLVKQNPLGVAVNDGNPGVDGARGHYARWDAATADCYLRVAAYNKDTHIKNSWLFGAAGDDQPAEVWRAAGDAFTCNKDLFGFSLMNKTATAAVVGVGGGTVLGVGIGAIAGHGRREFDCSNSKHRDMLMEELSSTGSIIRLNSYLTVSPDSTSKKLSREACENIMDLYDRFIKTKQALDECNASSGGPTMRLKEEEIDCSVEIVKEKIIKERSNGNPGKTGKEIQVSKEEIDAAVAECEKELSNAKPTVQCVAFPTLNLAKAAGRDVYSCTAANGPCIPTADVNKEIATLDKIITTDVIELIEKGEKANRGKAIGIGAATGAGAGSIATAIVAGVEHSNINCRLGDGLAQVGMGKSYSIGSLRDFYVKWNLNLPDTVSPTSVVDDCVSWRNACANFTHLEDCKNAQVNYRPTASGTTTLIRSACEVSGSACIENYPVAKSYGVCE